MSFADGFRISRYEARDDIEARALDRLCVQGTRYRLSFRRPTFHRRAENFREWAIFKAVLDGRLVALAGIALKPARLFGLAATAAFGFDLRVHPELRGKGLGTRMTQAALHWAGDRCDLAYSWIAADNAGSRTVLHRVNGREGPSYGYLVYPTTRPLTSRHTPATVAPAVVHRLHIRHAGPFDLYTDPLDGRCSGHVGSWLVREGADLAGCSAWDGSQILAETVEALPTGLRLLGTAGAWALRLARLPRIPSTGQVLRSWYIHDFAATRPDMGRDLIRHVAGRARAAGIDYLYVVHLPAQRRCIDLARRDFPRPFAPVLRYEMLARPMGRGPAPATAYVDIRDL